MTVKKVAGSVIPACALCKSTVILAQRLPVSRTGQKPGTCGEKCMITFSLVDYGFLMVKTSAAR